MDFKFSTEDVAFREEVLDFLGEQLPPGWADLSEGPAEDGAAIGNAGSSPGAFTGRWPSVAG